MKYDSLNKQNRLYEYTLHDGTKIKRFELSNLVLDAIGDDKLSGEEVSKKVHTDYQTAQHIIRGLVTSGLLYREKKQRYTVYYKKSNDCLLADLLTPKSIVDSFVRTGNDIKRTLDDSLNISYPMNVNHQYRMGNTVYEGGE